MEEEGKKYNCGGGGKSRLRRVNNKNCGEGGKTIKMRPRWENNKIVEEGII